ncbi:MAG TPA: cupredoxin domain-containing protein [Dehalococcoidia bacterium]|nr:cupredoxin domain-containing protein [Dehalococcoidia bacterium]
MSRVIAGVLFLVAVFMLLGTACGGGGKGRQVAIAQTDEGCTPQTVQAARGEKLTFKIQNQGKKDHEFEGVNGAKVPEVEVPAGRTRSVDYTAPKQNGTQQIKCYIPNGSTTMISVTVGG